MSLGKRFLSQTLSHTVDETNVSDPLPHVRERQLVPFVASAVATSIEMQAWHPISRDDVTFRRFGCASSGPNVPLVRTATHVPSVANASPSPIRLVDEHVRKVAVRTTTWTHEARVRRRTASAGWDSPTRAWSARGTCTSPVGSTDVARGARARFDASVRRGRRLRGRTRRC